MHRDELPIAEPCSADWSAMTGDARKRFCDDCSLDVHDLSAMTEREAGRLLARSPSVCVRYTCDSSGQIVHKRSSLSRMLAMAAALFSATPALASPAPAQAPEGSTWVERVLEAAKEMVAPPEEVVSMGEVEVVMGDIAVPEPPPPPPPVRMGKIAMPREPIPTPPPATPLPRPDAGETVIPEVQDALDRQVR